VISGDHQTGWGVEKFDRTEFWPLTALARTSRGADVVVQIAVGRR
jgi:hypothetical protein